MTQLLYEGEWWKLFDVNYDDEGPILMLDCVRHDTRIVIGLNKDEQEAAYGQLADADVPYKPWSSTGTNFFWHYGSCDAEGNPGVVIYPRSLMSVELPHAAGLELLDILRRYGAPVETTA
jgi:hypothetical protein